MRRAAWVLTLLVACIPREAPDDADSDGGRDPDTDGAACADGLGASVWYLDEDGDGLGLLDDDTLEACDAPPGYAAKGGDCDDRDPTLPAWRYEDADRDGYGSDTLLFDCEHHWRATVSGDCDDDDGTRYPGAPAICSDGIVNDCDAIEETVCRYDGWYELGVLRTAVIGTERMGLLTSALATSGDVDGNGTDDLVVGARNAATTADYGGIAYLVTDPRASDVDASAAARLLGTAEMEFVGATAAHAGDLDGDGVPDLAVEGDGGGVFLFSGVLRGDHAATEAAFAYLPGAPYVESYVGGFDWTGDGHDDLAAGAVFATADGAGVLWIFAGPVSGEPEPWGSISGTVEMQQFGDRVARVADTNGDGLPELAVKAVPVRIYTRPRVGGDVYLLTEPQGGSTTVDEAANALLYGLEEEHIGETIGSGDVDGDGYGDMLISASASHTDGADRDVTARLVRGPVTGEHMAGDIAQLTIEDREGCCSRVEIPGDVDGDGFDDLLVAAPADPHPNGGSGAGSVHLIYGGADLSGTLTINREPVLTESDAVFFGAPGDIAGEVLAGGDFDGDGFADFAIGARDHSTTEPSVGALYIVFGQPW